MLTEIIENGLYFLENKNTVNCIITIVIDKLPTDYEKLKSHFKIVQFQEI